MCPMRGVSLTKSILFASAPTNLLVFPLECNFDGSISSAQEIKQTSRASKSNWFSMLDIAEAAATSEICALDPDFACVSFYKIWGAPTGLGCLFVKRSSMNSLTTTCTRQSTCKRGGRRRYVGGGAVDILCLPNQDFTRSKSSPSPLDALTSGTINFRSILSLKPGFHEVQKLGMNLVSHNQRQKCECECMKFWFGYWFQVALDTRIGFSEDAMLKNKWIILARDELRLQFSCFPIS